MPHISADEKEAVLVTGGSGYLGSWAIIALLEDGYPVRTTSNNELGEAI
jgi:uncharacterized protein YbjT (DUF2867 family)